MNVSGVNLNVRVIARDMVQMWASNPVGVTKLLLEYGWEVFREVLDLLVFWAKTRLDIARLR